MVRSLTHHHDLVQFLRPGAGQLPIAPTGTSLEDGLDVRGTVEVAYAGLITADGLLWVAPIFWRKQACKSA
ncbi:MAG: hypothetical protein PVG20_06970 [Thioalkalispiraceae bacterium]|jgi:hypothetical protein